jgi:hypothetical protein
MRTLIVVLLASLGWLTIQAKWIRDRHELLDELQGQALVEIESEAEPWMHVSISPVQQVIQHETAEPWGLRLLGERRVQLIAFKGPPKSALSKRVQSLFPEAEIVLLGTPPSRPGPRYPTPAGSP